MSRLGLAALAALSVLIPRAAIAQSADVGARANWLAPPWNTAAFQNAEELFPSRRVRAAGPALPLTPAAKAWTPTYSYGGKTLTAEQFMANGEVSGLLVLKGRTIVYERYARASDETTRFISFSMGKSMVSTLVGLAIADGKIGSVTDKVVTYLPEVKGGAYETATIQDVLEMSSGSSFSEQYASGDSGIGRFIGVYNRNEGGLYDFSRGFKADRKPGEKFNYASADTEILGALVARATGEPLSGYMARKLWTPMGAEGDARWLLDAPGKAGRELAAGGILATMRDYGRFGLLFAHGGKVGETQVVPAAWVAEATRPNRPQVQWGALGTESPFGYGYQWWLGPKGTGTFMAIGIYGQNIYIDPKNDLVVVKLAAWPAASGDDRRYVEAYGLYQAISAAAARGAF